MAPQAGSAELNFAESGGLYALAPGTTLEPRDALEGQAPSWRTPSKPPTVRCYRCGALGHKKRSCVATLPRRAPKPPLPNRAQRFALRRDPTAYAHQYLVAFLTRKEGEARAIAVRAQEQQRYYAARLAAALADFPERTQNDWGLQSPPDWDPAGIEASKLVWGTRADENQLGRG